MKKLLLALVAPAFLAAYAPLIPSGRLSTEVTYGYFGTDRFYDKEGNNLDSYNDFKRNEITAIFELGISNRDNLVFKAGYDYIIDHLNGTLCEMNEGEAGWKRELYAWDDAILSAELMAIIPLKGQYEAEVRYGQYGAEAALLWAQSFFPFGKKLTLDSRLAYRWYAGFPSDQIRCNLAAWVDLSCRWQILAESKVEYGLLNGREPHDISFFFYNAKYRVWKGKLEAIFYVNNRLALSVGYMRHFIGERIAVGGEWYTKLLFCF